MVGEYTLETLSYGVHHRDVKFIGLVQDPLDKYWVKDRAQETGLINLYQGSQGQLMDSWEVQKDSHTPRT